MRVKARVKARASEERVVTRIRSKAIRLHAPHPRPLTSIRPHSRAAAGPFDEHLYYHVLVTLSVYPLSVIQNIDKDLERGKKRENKSIR